MEEIKVNPKKKKSSKGKIAISIVSIFLACIFLFGASFILSLGYLINPTPIVFGQGKDADELEKENQELKDEIELLQSKIDSLEARAQDYKNTVPSELEPEAAAEPETTTSEPTAPTTSGQSLHSQKAEAEEKKTETKKTETKKEDTTTKFEAETTVTPNDDKELSEPASEDITVVEID